METTRKYPRTLQEAFGPYAHHSQFNERYDAMPKADRIVVVASLVVGIVLAAMAVFGWLPGGGV